MQKKDVSVIATDAMSSNSLRTSIFSIALAAATIGLAIWLPSPTYNIQSFSVKAIITYDAHLPPVFEVAVTVDTLSLSLSSMDSEASNMPSDTVFIGHFTEIRKFTFYTKESQSRKCMCLYFLPMTSDRRVERDPVVGRLGDKADLLDTKALSIVAHSLPT